MADTLTRARNALLAAVLLTVAVAGCGHHRTTHVVVHHVVVHHVVVHVHHH